MAGGDAAGTKRVRTMCPMNCHPTLCGMIAETRDGRLLGVQGDPDNPDSRGFLCVRGRASAEISGNPARLLRPQMRARRGAPLEPCSWDDALDRIASSIQRNGPSTTGVWTGHGLAATDYGTRIGSQYAKRFAHRLGCQVWSGSIICWGLGAFGLGLTGLLETNTKEDMGQHAELILLWGANLASQPNTTRHLLAARRRGARVVTIDVRETEAHRHSDETLTIRPGTDGALALSLMHVLVGEGLHDATFVRDHCVGFDELAMHVAEYSPAWAEAETGVPAERIVALARSYASTRASMILVGGSSLHKGHNGWQAARAIACLPALTGAVGRPGGGLGPRHGSASHGQGLASIAGDSRLLREEVIPNQMGAILDALDAGRLSVMLLLGTNMLSSFSDAGRVARGLSRTELVVNYDIFMNDTARQCADVVLPGTAWLEQLGCKSTHTHLYLMEPALEPPGEARPIHRVLRQLAERLGDDGYFPWRDETGAIDAILDHPATGGATVASLRERGGIGVLDVSHVAHPDHHYATPSGKVEFVSERAAAMGLPALPVYRSPEVSSAHPLVLAQGRTFDHFHAFYDHGRALPTLRAREAGPTLWMSAADAATRGITEGAGVVVSNQRGAFEASAHVTDRLPEGTVWMRDGWEGLNRVTSSDSVLPDDAVDALGFSAGQARFEARVQVEPLP